MPDLTRIHLGRREDLGADCGSCAGLCCVALAFTRSSDFPRDKEVGEPCEHLEGERGCDIHGRLRESGYKGCTVFDCFGAGQKVTGLYAGRSWYSDPPLGTEMFAVFSVVRRLHELLWYLDQALALPGDDDPWLRDLLATHFEHVRALTLAGPEAILATDVDGLYDAARPHLLAASAAARASVPTTGRTGRRPGPGSDLVGAELAGRDLSGLELRGALLIAADLSGCDLTLTDVLGADLRDADLSGARLDRAIYLTQTQVSAARGDAATALPDGFERPPHWAGA